MNYFMCCWCFIFPWILSKIFIIITLEKLNTLSSVWPKCFIVATVCSSSSDDVILYRQQCYVKYDTENVTWYEARNTCISSGGDLATFNYPDSSYDINLAAPLNTSWLIPNLSYWVGIRYNEWSWISPSGQRLDSIGIFCIAFCSLVVLINNSVIATICIWVLDCWQSEVWIVNTCILAALLYVGWMKKT